MFWKSAILWGDSQQTREATAPWGYAGGGLGGFVLNPGTAQEEVLKARIPKRTLKRGDVLRVIGAGGGWGDPAIRDPDAARDDVVEGYVSEAQPSPYNAGSLGRGNRGRVSYSAQLPLCSSRGYSVTSRARNLRGVDPPPRLGRRFACRVSPRKCRRPCASNPATIRLDDPYH